MRLGQWNELELFTRKALVAIGLFAGAALLWAARGVLLLVFIAGVVASGIAPAVHAVRVRWRLWFRRSLPRAAAVAIVYLPFLIAVLLVTVLVVPRFMADARDLGGQIPALLEENVLRPLERYVPVGFLREEMRGGFELPRTRVFAYMRNAATTGASILAVLFMVAYMLIDAQRLRNFVLLLYPPESRSDRRRTLDRMAARMSSWLSGQLVLSAIIGVTSFTAFTLLGIPYALPLAIIAAVGELIPVLGPTVGAVPALAVALFQSRWQFWAVLVFVILLQKIENLFIVPRVMSRKVAVSPLAIFVAFMIGASLLGVVGAIIAIPVVALIQVAFEEAFVARRERRQDNDRAGTLLRKAD